MLFLGLLELPGLLTTAEPEPLPVYAEPKAGTPKAVLRSSKDIPTEEYDSDARGAFVLKRSSGWALIRLKDGAGWVSPERAGAFHAYEELVTGHRSYLTPDWDGRIWTKPGGKSDAKVLAMDAADNKPVKVLRAKRVRKGLWFELSLLTHVCESIEPEVVAEGWIPAYSASEIGRAHV